MSEETAVTMVSALPDSQIYTKKIAVCAVSLGTAILNEMLGNSLASTTSTNTEELVAAAILSELKL